MIYTADIDSGDILANQNPTGGGLQCPPDPPAVLVRHYVPSSQALRVFVRLHPT